ncbi:hypothetical protein D9756_003181 [Leucocoprinus leucothites]|uniref:Homeobox domain-containing protein n=1 Tax=Leucocoprinus leucothites TaxID=201217 RepID=A0A8H5G791_9AGAR|nr:hypothetical protein D9756_003181 [Leucoagaricus leucothites]
MAPRSPADLPQLHDRSSSPSRREKALLSTSPKEDLPKKKRGRLTKEQLAQLERLFAVDCSPTVVRRREIALQVGCPERQIQVWFQNRRAKAKSSGEKCKTRPRGPSPVKEPPELCQAVQTDFEKLIQEDDSSVFTIPCTTLTIGAWNRVNFEDEHDLLAWICEKKRCFTWFVRSSDYSFKMQVPLDALKELAFKNADPGKAFLALDLSSPPTFFLRRNLKREQGVPPPCWRRCEDWTESKAATRNLRHVLGGPALPLANVVTYVKNLMEDTKPVTLHPVDHPTPTDNHQFPSQQTSTSISTTPTYPSPVMDDAFYLQPLDSSRGWDSASCSDGQAPVNDTKALANVYYGSDRSRVGALPVYSTKQYGDMYNEHDGMRLLGTDAGLVSAPPRRLSPLEVPQPKHFYSESGIDTATRFHPPTYYQSYPTSGSTGYHQRPSHQSPYFPEFFSPSNDSY